MNRRVLKVVAGVFVIALLGACGKAADDSSAGRVEGPVGSTKLLMRDSGRPESEAVGAPSVANDTASEAAPQPMAGLYAAPGDVAARPGDKVVKTAEMSVEVEEDTFQEKFAKAGAIAEQFGGFVTSSNTTETEGRIASGSITIRVPADKFQSAISAMKALGEIKADAQHGQDVTAEFVDLEARLRQLKAEEAFYLKLIDEAKAISDMITIHERLAAVQSQIEQTQGRLQYLNDQTSFSTITARIFEPSAALKEPKGLGKAWSEAWVNFKTVISNLIVALGWLAPFVILGALGFGAWRVYRRKPVAQGS